MTRTLSRCSTFFSRAKIATTVGTVVFLATFFPYYAVNNKDSNAKVGAGILPSVAFSLSLDVLATLEDAGLGATRETSSNVYDNYTFGTGASEMHVGCLLWLSSDVLRCPQVSA